MNVGEYTLNQFMNIKFDKRSAMSKVRIFRAMLANNAMQLCSGNKSKAAELLGTTRCNIDYYRKAGVLNSDDVPSNITLDNVFIYKLVSDLKKHLANEAMNRANSNATEAARSMGITTTTFTNWLQCSVTEWKGSFNWDSEKEEWLRVNSRVKSVSECAKELSVRKYVVANKLKQMGIKAKKHKDWWLK